MPKPDARGAAGLADLARMAANAFLERLGERMSDLSRDVLRLYPNSVERWLLFKPDRYALLHGDYRLDNIMFGPDGSVTVVDWQTIAVGLPARDLAYFLSTSLTPDRRRVHERRVVAAARRGTQTARRHRLQRGRELAGLPTRHAPRPPHRDTGSSVLGDHGTWTR